MAMMHEIVARLTRIEAMLAGRGPTMGHRMGPPAGHEHADWRGPGRPGMRTMMETSMREAGEKWEQASPEEREAMRKEWEARMQERREKMRQAREKWEQASPEEREAMRKERETRMQERRERMEAARAEGRERPAEAAGRPEEGRPRMEEARRRYRDMQTRIGELEAELARLKKAADSDD